MRSEHKTNECCNYYSGRRNINPHPHGSNPECTLKAKAGNDKTRGGIEKAKTMMVGVDHEGQKLNESMISTKESAK